MDQKISVSRVERRSCPASPNEHDRADGKHFPEDKEGKKVPCKDDPERTACINKPGNVLQVVPYVKGIKKGDKGNQVEDVTKKETQPVYLAKDQIISQKAEDPVGPLRDTDQVDEANDRDEKQKGAFPLSLEKGDQ
jgi:hypothetical protein